MKLNFKDWWANMFMPHIQERHKRTIGDRSATPVHKGAGGMGITRASHEESKTHRQMAARSRRINQGGSKRK